MKILFSEQDITFKTIFEAETFKILNVQTQSIPFNQSHRKKRIFEIIIFYFETRQLIIISSNICSFGCINT